MVINRRNWVAAVLVVVAVMAARSGYCAEVPIKPSSPEAASKDPGTVYRFNVLGARMEPIARNDLKPGCIYQHFSPRLNRWVWSYVREDGTFWNALGYGTTQEARRFDIRPSDGDVRARIESMPELAKQLDSSGGRVMMELREDGTWKVLGPGIAASFYDQETGQRWDWHTTRYLPVVHTGGNRWAVQNGRYVPQ